jgi:hypothetical protein
MDPLSITASIIAVLQLANKVLKYMNHVKEAPKERTECVVELLTLSGLLSKLRAHIEDGDLTQPWYTAAKDLASRNGPLDQLIQALETLLLKFTDGGRRKKIGDALIWKFKKEEIAGFLERIERLKTLVSVALQLDHV